MRLIVGGYAQGQLEYALALTGEEQSAFVEGSQCSYEALVNAKGVYNFQEYIKKFVVNQQVDEVLRQIPCMMSQNPEITIVADEVGCGVVPMDPVEREYRELTGRVLGNIARESIEVHRVYCGIGTKIKG